MKLEFLDKQTGILFKINNARPLHVSTRIDLSQYLFVLGRAQRYTSININISVTGQPVGLVDHITKMVYIFLN